MLSGGTEWDQWHEMGYMAFFTNIFKYLYK